MSRSLRDTTIFFALAYSCFVDIQLVLSVIIFIAGSTVLRYYGMQVHEVIRESDKAVLPHVHGFFKASAIGIVAIAIYLIIRSLINNPDIF